MFKIPERPWKEDDIKLLKENLASLDAETRAELGITPIAPDNNFRAGVAKPVEPEVTPEVTPEMAPVVAEEIKPEEVTVDNTQEVKPEETL